jgi:DNA-binding SARP family transcriptional activator
VTTVLEFLAPKRPWEAGLVPAELTTLPAHSAIWSRLQQALSEHEVRSATIRHLLAALEEQQARLEVEMAAALETLTHATLGEPSEAQAERPPSTPNPGQTIVRCFGSFEVEMAGVPIQNWRSGKARAVFEYLVSHRRRPVPRDTLIQAVWPDPDALAAATSLKVAVHALRQIFSENRGSAARPAVSVMVQESTYQVVAPGLWVDVEEFEQCATLGMQLEAHGHAAQALVHYERAADLYRGDFLADTWDDWVVFRREGLKDRYLTILARVANARFKAGDYERCIELCRLLLEQDSCREDTFRVLMLCHAKLGQRGRVRRWYELCVETLRTTLDAEPEPETHRVYLLASSGRG